MPKDDRGVRVDVPGNPNPAPNAVAEAEERLARAKARLEHGAELKATSRFWCGITSDCPLTPLVLCGVDFHIETELVQWDEKRQKHSRFPVKGDFRDVPGEVMDLIRVEAQRRIIRRNGPGAVQLFDMESPSYYPAPQDKPFSAFMYAVPVPPGGLEPNRSTEPPTFDQERAAAQARGPAAVKPAAPKAPAGARE